MVLDRPAKKSVYVKLTQYTELYVKVERCAQLMDVPMTKAARLMMRNGYLGFRRYLEDEGYEVNE